MSTAPQAGRKSRGLVKVTPYKNPAGLNRCKVELEGGAIVALHELTRPELAEAAKMVFPTLPGNAWFRMTSDLVQTLIRDNDLERARTAVDEQNARLAAKKQSLAYNEKGYPEHGSSEGHEYVGTRTEAPPNPTQAAAEGIDPAEQALLDAFRASRKPSMDLEQVQALIETEVKRQVIEQGVTRIEVVTPAATHALPGVHHHLLPELVTIFGSTRCHVLLVGPAGSGKSTLIEQAAAALGRPFHALSMGPTTPTSKIFGYQDANGNAVRTPSWDGFEHGGIVLWDELDNGHPGLIAETNQMTANGYAAFAAGMVKKHDACRIGATANTFGRGPDRMFVGRNILDAATLDRFVTIEVPIDEKLERHVAAGYKTGKNDAQVDRWVDYVQRVRAKVTTHALPVIVSPRATFQGIELLTAGLTMDRVKEIRLFAGISKDILTKIA